MSDTADTLRGLAPYARLAVAREAVEEQLRRLYDAGCYPHELRMLLDALSLELSTLERRRDAQALELWRGGVAIADALARPKGNGARK